MLFQYSNDRKSRLSFQMKRRKEFLWIRTQLNAAIDVSMMEQGDEIYAFSEYWPMTPQTISINEDIEMADITITKNVVSTDLTKDHNCEIYHTKSYGGK